MAEVLSGGELPAVAEAFAPSRFDQVDSRRR
jgi:hypothetical protein